MTIFSHFRRNPRAALIAALHRRIAEAARDRALYARLGVADTVRGPVRVPDAARRSGAPAAPCAGPGGRPGAGGFRLPPARRLAARARGRRHGRAEAHEEARPRILRPRRRL